ncbi:MAG: ABC transporter permease subunit [Chitinivibrionales bacterium]|nr:ABC transporter permease subunit [Chitinivibrionales bacterium]
MKKENAGEAVKHGAIILILALAFVPLYVMVIISFKSNSQFMQNQFGLTFPLHLENWVVAWGIVKNYIFNTIFVATTAVAFSFCFTIPAAYFFARYRMPFHNFFWYFFLFLMLMPTVANLIPLFMVIKSLNLLNSLFALIILGLVAGQVLQIYILRQFIEDIPQDLFDAAEIDGAGPLMQVWNIVVPMSGSIVSTLAIMQFIGIWNDFIMPMVLIRDDSLLTLAAGLVKLDGEYVKLWGQMMAGYAISSIPLILIFVFTMRLFVKGLSSGAVKG